MVRQPGRLFEVPAAVRAAAAARVGTLVFSTPYVWHWTEGLAASTRAGLLAAHGFALLAVVTWSDAADHRRGLPPHLGVTRDPDRRLPGTAGLLAPVFTALAVLASLTLASRVPLAPVVMTLVLAGAWVAAGLPLRVKYLAGPEIVAPLLVIAGPGLAAHRAFGADVEPLSVLAGAGFLSAIIVACHERDAPDDAADGVATVSTRRPERAGFWLWVTSIGAALAGTATLYLPLTSGEWLSIVGAWGFVAARILGRGRVPAMALAHAVFALSLLLR